MDILGTMIAAHYVGDIWVQTDQQAKTKALPTWRGRAACAVHTITYTLTITTIVAISMALGNSTTTALRAALAIAVTAISHYAADRRVIIARLASYAHGSFHALGSPRPGKDDNPTLATGAFHLDQAWHMGWLIIAAWLIG